MRLAALSLVVLVAVAAGGCKSDQKAEAGKQAPRALARPDLGPDFLWAGQALPTGDLATSVITLEKTLPASVGAGGAVQYSIRVKNVSAAEPLPDVVVADTVPDSGFTLENTTPAAKRSGNTLSWDFGTLAPGASRDITVSGRATSLSDVSASATVWYGRTPAPAPAKAAPPAKAAAAAPPAKGAAAAPPAKGAAAPPPAKGAPAPKLELTMSAPAEAKMSDDIVIKLVVKNSGNAAAADVKVVAQLPEGWTVDGKPTVTFTVGALAAGASKELTAKARAPKAGKFTNKATATGAAGLTASATGDTVVK